MLQLLILTRMFDFLSAIPDNVIFLSIWFPFVRLRSYLTVYLKQDLVVISKCVNCYCNICSFLTANNICYCLPLQPAAGVSFQDGLKHQHTQKVMDIQEHSACLSVAGVSPRRIPNHQGSLVKWRGEECIGMYWFTWGAWSWSWYIPPAHPVVLEDAFQLISFVVESLAAVAWVPPRISRMVMYHAGTLHHSDQETWARISLVNDGLKMKSCDIYLYNKKWGNDAFWKLLLCKTRF